MHAADALPLPPPRYSDRVLPAYAYLPGGSLPHPVRDPAGHSHRADPPEPLLPPERWAGQGDYLHGVDLFNAGYFWEAHEAWEGLWQQATGVQRQYLHGMIQLAAAMLKQRCGLPRGARRLAERAAARLTPIAAAHARYMGTAMADVERALQQLKTAPGHVRFAIHLDPTPP